MTVTPCRDWPGATFGCHCIHCERRFLGRSHRMNVCQYCKATRQKAKHRSFCILLERAVSERLIVGTYRSFVAADGAARYWDKRHGWRASVLPLFQSTDDRIAQRGPL